MRSTSSLKPRAARGQLWAVIAAEAGVSDPFSFTPEVIHAVMAIPTSAGYRSAHPFCPLPSNGAFRP
eukprot:2964986-Alexandrium_andersonii.AAC.1